MRKWKAYRKRSRPWCCFKTGALPYVTCNNERVPYYEKYADIVIDEEGKNAGETVDELRNIIEGMMDQKMIQMFIDEQKRKLEERDRLLSEKDEEIRQLKARIAQLEGK